MAIYRYLGLQNAGKTAIMVRDACIKFFSGKDLYANIHLNIPHTFINCDYVMWLAENDHEIRNAVFLLDEYWIWADARSSQSKVNKMTSYFLLQTSKLGIDVMFTAQTDRQDDSRLRDNAHFLTECRRVLKLEDESFGLITSEERYLPPEINKKLYIEATRRRRNAMGYLGFDKCENIRALPLFSLYDTSKKMTREKS